jgi:hypothetical protein
MDLLGGCLFRTELVRFGGRCAPAVIHSGARRLFAPAQVLYSAQLVRPSRFSHDAPTPDRTQPLPDLNAQWQPDSAATAPCQVPARG